MEQWDVVIIGAGPAGLTAAIYCARAKCKTLVLEALSAGGQLLMAGTIENYPGFPGGIPGHELVERFKKQVLELGVSLREFMPVESVVYREGLFELACPDERLYSRALIIATGAQPARLGVPGEDQFVGRGVSFCATCDGFFFKDRKVAVIGGGDRAVEEALLLKNLAREVYLIHRRDRLRAQKVLQDRLLQSGNVRVFWNTVVTEMIGDQSGIKALKIKDLREEKEDQLEVDGVFVAVGQKPSSELFVGLVDMDPNGFIITDPYCRTSLKGAFAAGDVRKKDLRQVTTAVGDGALAAWAAAQYLESETI